MFHKFLRWSIQRTKIETYDRDGFHARIYLVYLPQMAVQMKPSFPIIITVWAYFPISNAYSFAYGGIHKLRKQAWGEGVSQMLMPQHIYAYS